MQSGRPLTENEKALINQAQQCQPSELVALIERNKSRLLELMADEKKLQLDDVFPKELNRLIAIVSAYQSIVAQNDSEKNAAIKLLVSYQYDDRYLNFVAYCMSNAAINRRRLKLDLDFKCPSPSCLVCENVKETLAAYENLFTYVEKINIYYTLSHEVRLINLLQQLKPSLSKHNIFLAFHGILLQQGDCNKRLDAMLSLYSGPVSPCKFVPSKRIRPMPLK